MDRDDDKDATVKRGDEGAADQAEWDRVKVKLKHEFGDSAFKSWVNPIAFGGLQDGAVNLKVPTRFMRDWVVTHYADRIRTLWSGENPHVRRIQVNVYAPTDADQNHDIPRVESDEKSRPLTKSVQTLTSASGDPVFDSLSAPLDARYTFENFVVGKPNEFAYAAAQRVADSDHVSFNPLFLYGGVGLGKTHLMHAIAWQIRLRLPQRRVVYLSAEKFMYSFVRALRNHDTVSFKEQFRSANVLMIDDVQFISGKDSTQEEFFPHLQCVSRPGASNRIVGRQVTFGPRKDRGQTTVPFIFGLGCRSAPHHL